ncbi:MAG: DNA mismatch repair endonuclease MutL [Deltaproteobacteria bacterium]|nr:DNA mismatch repair endonuclease MutL [Deltaproteobacteria bacterium]MBW2594756.1 DNA mismatch repair endonuclease MutL [Deltaproteobacteria bacterium]
MQEKIVVMSEELSNRIAAGEVIERPASIVKELVENSLDAGATDILVELEGGGKRSVKIVDNGRGIGRDDVALAFERHATSKIYTFEDINNIASFGFRGEAIASIASISRIEMLTRKKGSLSGTRALVKGGRIEEIIDAGCPVGTSVSVSDIFYSTPARMKFMKGDATEQTHCIDAMMRLALSNPGVKIRVVANGKTVLNVPKTKNLSDRIALVFGEDFERHTLEIEGQRGETTLHGVISTPDRTRSNTKGQFYFINNRFIRDRLLNHSVITSYRRLIEPRRFPYVVLFVDMPASDVDINVHPAKMEVRFRNSSDIYSLVTDTLSGALSGMSAVRTGFPEPSFGVSADAYRERVGDVLKRYTVLSGAEKKTFSMNVSEEGTRKAPDSFGGREGEKELPNLFNERDVPEDTVTFSSLKYLGQIADTYLVFSSTGALILVDQHAAHERVLFEKLKMSTGEETQIQGLLFPEVVNLQPGRFDLLMNNIDALKDVGLGVERYGENTILIKQIPAFLTGCNLEELISDIIEEIGDTGKTANIDETRDKILTTMACKGAVKANHSLTDSEIAALCEDLDSIPFAATCPHGRPTYAVIDIRDLERMFKRR